MNIIIRKIKDTEHEYLAYSKSLCNKATYLLYFLDNIFGAVILNNFIEMIRTYFKPTNIVINIIEKEVSFKNEYLLELIRD